MNDTTAPATLSLPRPEHLGATPVIDADHPEVAAFAERVAGHLTDPVEAAKALYLAVRDEIRYDPYHVNLSVDGLKASRVLTDGRSWCVPKAALLAAVCRARGIPAGVGYADVRNHLSTERLRQMIGTNDYVWHGYTNIHLDGRWVKATPAFNRALCEKLGVEPLEFDGTADSLYQEYDTSGRRHLQYIQQRGDYDDVPVESIREAFTREYPKLVELGQADFDRDVANEQAR
jgi:transglutaminase-like putative cysteine protease